jgi:hypothetical protein
MKAPNQYTEADFSKIDVIRKWSFLKRSVRDRRILEDYIKF